MIRLVIQISRGLILSQHARRVLMFYGLVVALVMLFIGSGFFDWLRARPILFILYWGACAWITTLSTLLAIFDLLAVRLAGRRLRRRLEAEYLQKEQDDAKDGPYPPGA